MALKLGGLKMAPNPGKWNGWLGKKMDFNRVGMKAG